MGSIYGSRPPGSEEPITFTVAWHQTGPSKVFLIVSGENTAVGAVPKLLMAILIPASISNSYSWLSPNKYPFYAAW